MERLSIFFLVAAAFVGANALTHGQAAGQDGNAALEQELATLREEMKRLRADLDETRALLDETVAYLERGSKNAADLEHVLAASEAAGFTFGINPASREILLEGWRKELADRQKGVPGTPPPPPVQDGQRRAPTRQ